MERFNEFDEELPEMEEERLDEEDEEQDNNGYPDVAETPKTSLTVEPARNP